MPIRRSAVGVTTITSQRLVYTIGVSADSLIRSESTSGRATGLRHETGSIHGLGAPKSYPPTLRTSARITGPVRYYGLLRHLLAVADFPVSPVMQSPSLPISRAIEHLHAPARHAPCNADHAGDAETKTVTILLHRRGTGAEVMFELSREFNTTYVSTSHLQGLSGAAAGIKARLVLFEVLVLSFAAASSGGIIRDFTNR